MVPILREVAAEMQDHLAIVRIDVDQNPDLSQQLNIQGLPTFILYQQGEIKWRHSGMHSAFAIIEALSPIVKAIK
jgi:thioredoxin 1